jgi:hypothetical protein
MSGIDHTEQSSTDQAGGEQQESGRGLADAIASAFKEVGLEEEGEPSAETPAAGKTRGEPSAEARPAAEDEEESDKQVGETTQPASQFAAPTQWDAAKKAKFAQLPDTAKSIVLDLAKSQEADYTRKTTELAHDRRFAQNVRSLITDDHREQLREAGLDEVQGFKRLLEYQDYALSQPKNYLRWFAKAANLRPTDIWPEIAGARQPQPQPQPGARPQPQPGNGAVDPQIQQLRGVVEHLSGWVNEQQKREKQVQREQTVAVERQAKSVIERFRSAADDKGEATYPHFVKVEDRMTEILMAGMFREVEDPMERLKAAYDAAVAWDPELRQQLVDIEAAAARKKSDVSKAMDAKPPVQSKIPSGEPKPEKGALKDFVSRAMEDVGVT